MEIVTPYPKYIGIFGYVEAILESRGNGSDATYKITSSCGFVIELHREREELTFADERNIIYDSVFLVLPTDRVRLLTLVVWGD